ncbi:MAG: DUF3999 family protein [Pseudomonadota bacterium]
MRWSGAWLLALAASAGAGELPLQLTGEGPYHTLRVPLDVRAQAGSAGLDDLRVLNAAGVAVPHAWVDDDPAGVAQPRRQAVPLFKAPPPKQAASGAPAQRGGWIVDLRAVAGLPQELQLDVTPGTNGIYPFALEASADLQQWRTLVAEAQLVALQHQGLRLAHTSFELDGARGGYLRLQPLPGGPELPVTAARVASLAHQAAALPDWQWSEALAPARCEPAYCDYVLPRHLPLQRVEFLLAEPNTLARVQLLAQPDDAPVPATSRLRHHHPVREHLRALRHKTVASSPRPAEDRFWPQGSGTVYALDLQGRAVRSTVLELPGGLHRTLRVQPTGGMAQLGSQPPQIRVAGRAQSLVFLARGEGPYRLAWAQTSPPVELPLAQLMPGRRPGDPLPGSTAGVAPRAVAMPAAPAPSAPAKSTPVAGATPHKLWLWAALVAALALMGFMVRSLLKPSAPAEGASGQ